MSAVKSMIETLCAHLEETASATFYSCAVTLASRESGCVFVKPYGTDEVLKISSADTDQVLLQYRNAGLILRHFSLMRADSSLNCAISGELSKAPRVSDEEEFSRKIVEYTAGLGSPATEYKNGFVTCAGYDISATAENFICAVRIAESISSLDTPKTRGFYSLNEFFANRK